MHSATMCLQIISVTEAMLRYTYSSPRPLAMDKRVHWNHIRGIVLTDLMDDCQLFLHQVVILAP